MARVIDMRCEYQKDYGDLVCHLTLLFTNRREDTKGDIVEYVTNKYGEYFMGHVRQIKDQTPMDYFHSFEGMSIVERVNDFSTHEFEMYFDDVEMAVALLEERVAWSRYSKQFDSQIEKVLKK